MEIGRVNDGEFALSKRYAAKRVAIAQTTIQKDKPNERAFQQDRNIDCDVVV